MDFQITNNPGRNCLVAQSGGPTAAINASLAGVIRAAAADSRIGHIYGAVNGIQGVLAGKLIDLAEAVGTDADSLSQLETCPAMYLGSCRYKLAENEGASDDYARIFEILARYEIGYFFYIGGNDSMDTVKKLDAYGHKLGSDIRFVGVPKTIDNDLPVIDHTPGYGSAARYIATSILEMAHDTYIYNTQSVLIVEIMGRDAGWLTAASSLARNEYSAAPHLIYLPERAFSNEQFLSDLRSLLAKQNHIIIAVSEGIRYADGTYVSASSDAVDQFGHAMLNGAGKYLEQLVANEIGCKVRSVEVNVLQRCASHLSSAVDLAESASLGSAAVKGALEGKSGVMAILRRVSDDPYQVEYDFTPVENVANQEKRVPDEWINPEGNDVTGDFLRYARPLIQGNPAIRYENGLPVYLSVKHLG